MPVGPYSGMGGGWGGGEGMGFLCLYICGPARVLPLLPVEGMAQEEPAGSGLSHTQEEEGVQGGRCAWQADGWIITRCPQVGSLASLIYGAGWGIAYRDRFGLMA